MIKKDKVFIIAEAGVNHNGNIKLAYKLIDKASLAKVDAIKFQTFTANTLVTKNARMAKYQSKDKRFKSQFEMLKKLEFSKAMHKKCIIRCKKRNINFLSSPFSIEDVVFLEQFNLMYFKIPSGEITNLPYLRFIAGRKKKIILSTGMSTNKEINVAVNVLKKYGTNLKDIILLHCNSAYPTPYEDVNLNSIILLKKKFRVKIGISDHSQGIEVPISAVALGAVVVEKHFTLSRKLKGPDHSSSIEPEELNQMVKSIRNIEKALNTKKKITRSEKNNIKIVRKSIVARRDILKEEFFTEKNLTCKRPGTGISPMLYDKVIGLKAKKNFKTDDIIKIKGL
tara:strand:+ start:2690 stop:3706 length:1017 start_codon:yes stop_codon:yes gene_type:complete